MAVVTEAYNDDFNFEEVIVYHDGRTMKGPPTALRWNRGSRTFDRRKKPITEFLMPTQYDLSVETLEYFPIVGDISLSPYYKSIVNPRYFYGFWNDTGSGSYTGTRNRLPAFSTNLYNGVITDLRLKVKNQELNLGIAFAERQRTAQLLADSLGRIARSITYLKKGKWKKAQRELSRKRDERRLAAWMRKHPITGADMYRKPAAAWTQAPASWLEFQYGWSPLIADVMGSIDTLSSLDDPVDWLMTVKAGRSEKSKGSTKHSNAIYQLQISAQDEWETFRGIFARADFTPNDATFMKTLANTAGITNPALIAWELIPFSFVLDWGVKVGDYLSSLDATLFAKFHSGSYTDRRELHARRVPVDSRYGNGAIVKWQSHRPSKGRRFELHRKVWSSWPLATAPRFKDPLSATHVANSLSLLAEALKSAGTMRFR